jgi:hypothetical protein
LAGLPPLAARLVKESMNSGQDIPNVRDAALADMYRFYVLELTEDKVEGHSAWRERREPASGDAETAANPQGAPGAHSSAPAPRR